MTSDGVRVMQMPSWLSTLAATSGSIAWPKAWAPAGSFCAKAHPSGNTMRIMQILRWCSPTAKRVVPTAFKLLEDAKLP